jgi:acetoacetyl-CoA synthetase
MLFVHRSATHHGRSVDLDEPIAGAVRDLRSLELVVGLEPDVSVSGVPCVDLERLRRESAAPLAAWPKLPFNHPLFVLFSSGTTGAPKGIVHGSGGTLLEHLKEHRLHGDLTPADVLYFHTSVGWMMWNWALTALATGARLVLYDGSPTYPDGDRLWRVVADEGVTVLGTSPTYLQYCEDAGLSPRDLVDLRGLRAIQSTGSILRDRQYDWVHTHVGELPLQSISGGTDILGCFVLGNPNLPVYRGESQCVGLGLDVRAHRTERCTGLAPEVGELVCGIPFPSRPLGFLGDESGERFAEAYFSQNEGFWTHGDFLEITPRGGARILGRSDGVLNIRGIRIGPAEIYSVLERFPEIRESLALEQHDPKAPGGSRLVLLVVLREGTTLDRALTLSLKKAIKSEASSAHVPSIIAPVSALPVTFSGKTSARAARDALEGRAAANRGAIRNPDVLDEIAHHPELRVNE